MPPERGPKPTRITIGGNCISYLGYMGMNTASLELVNLVINSLLSHQGAKFSCFDGENIYLVIPLDQPEYVNIKLYNIPQ